MLWGPCTLYEECAHRSVVQMGIHEEELLWLAERVKHLKGCAGEILDTTVHLQTEPANGGLRARHLQISAEANGVNISTDAKSEQPTGTPEL